MPRSKSLLPLSVRRALRELGRDLQHARRRRRLSANLVAERAQIARPTLWRAERGDASVGIGTYATILWVLGMTDRIGKLAAPETDMIGLSMADEELPQRIRNKRGKRPASAENDHGRETGSVVQNPTPPKGSV